MLFSVPRLEHQRIADIFVKKGPYLKMYSTYIKEFDKNVALLDEQCKRNAGFAAVVRDFEVLWPLQLLWSSSRLCRLFFAWLWVFLLCGWGF